MKPQPSGNSPAELQPFAGRNGFNLKRLTHISPIINVTAVNLQETNEYFYKLSPGREIRKLSLKLNNNKQGEKTRF